MKRRSASAAWARRFERPDTRSRAAHPQARLLAGSGYQASQGEHGYRLVKQGEVLEMGATNVIGQEPAATTEGSGSYTSGAVTLGKGVQRLKDIPQSVTVITRKQMDDQNTETISDLAKRIKKIPKAIDKATMAAVIRRIDSVSQSLSSLPIPKGIDPTKVRAQRPR